MLFPLKNDTLILFLEKNIFVQEMRMEKRQKYRGLCVEGRIWNNSLWNCKESQTAPKKQDRTMIIVMNRTMPSGISLYTLII